MTTAFKRIALASVLSLSFSLCATVASAQQQTQEAPLTNASVIKLVRAGFKEKTLVAIINSRPSRFDLSPDRLIELKKSGVSERVILAMLARDENILVSDEEFGDDPFFGDANGQTRRGQSSGGDGGTGIFGSGSGSQSRTRGRGMSGGSQGDTQTSGSATVRILRPPAEAGGAAPPTLERTPTLTNDSIVELVEAGFSEGTIIRRIEQSPAEFDLSPARLAELRRRRVSEPIINAMRAAMNDDTANKQG